MPLTSPWGMCQQQKFWLLLGAMPMETPSISTVASSDDQHLHQRCSQRGAKPVHASIYIYISYSSHPLHHFISPSIYSITISLQSSSSPLLHLFLSTSSFSLALEEHSYSFDLKSFDLKAQDDDRERRLICMHGLQ